MADADVLKFRKTLISGMVYDIKSKFRVQINTVTPALKRVILENPRWQFLSTEASFYIMTSS